ncbi:MAG: VCBS domain-containing protein [Halarcobacter sp.]
MNKYLNVILLLGLLTSLYAKESLDMHTQNLVNDFKNSDTFKQLSNGATTTVSEKYIDDTTINVDFSNAIESAKLFGDEVINSKLDAIQNEHEEYMHVYNQDDYFTIFYFISKSMRLSVVENFLYKFEKLREKRPNIEARLMFAGYPKFLSDRKRGVISTRDTLVKKSFDTAYGSFNLREDGNWNYVLNEKTKALPLKNKQIVIDSIKFHNAGKNKEYLIDIKITKEEDRIGIVIDDSPDGIIEYMKVIQERVKINHDGIFFHVNPWAFDTFKLKQVPAYAISKCKKPYAFKSCDNKYLVKGELDLVATFEIIGDENEKYKPIYFDLIEAR